MLHPQGVEFTENKSGRINGDREESKLATTESIRLTKAKDKHETNKITENVSGRSGWRGRA
jgi:hypothetical protein